MLTKYPNTPGLTIDTIDKNPNTQLGYCHFFMDKTAQIIQLKKNNSNADSLKKYSSNDGYLPHVMRNIGKVRCNNKIHTQETLPSSFGPF
jgi:hypothetical protein